MRGNDWWGQPKGTGSKGKPATSRDHEAMEERQRKYASYVAASGGKDSAQHKTFDAWWSAGQPKADK